MPIYVPLALAAALCFSLNGIFSKLASKHAIKNKFALLFYFYLTGLFFLPIIPILGGIQNPIPALLPLMLYSLVFFIAYFFFYTVLFRYDISILQPLFHFQSIFSVFLAFLILGERFAPQTYLWIILIILGGFFVTYDEKLKLKALISQKFFIFLVAILFFSFADIFAARTMKILDFYNLKFWSNVFLFTMSLIFLPLAGKNLKITISQYTPVLGSGFFFFIAHLFFFSAIAYNITISQPLAMFGSFFTLIISIILSRIRPEFLEHHPLKIYAFRSLGVLLMLTAAIMISLI